MSAYSFSLLLAWVFNFLIALFVFIKNPKAKPNQSFFFLNLSLTLWLIGCFGQSVVVHKNSALRWDQIIYTGVSLYPLTYLNFLNKTIRGRKTDGFFKLVTIISLLFLIINLTTSLRTYLIKDVVKNYPFRFIAVPNTLWFLLVAFVIFISTYGVYLLYAAYKKSGGYVRNQIRYLIIAFTILPAGGGMYFLLPLNINTPPIDSLFVVSFSAIIAFTILKYHLMDIRLAITKASLFIFTYTLILGIPFVLATIFKEQLVRIFGGNWLIWPLALMGILATAGPFIYIYLDRKAEETLLREQKRYQNTLKQASIGMTRIRNLKRLLELIAHIVTKTVKINYVAIYIYDYETDKYVLQVSRDKGRVPIPKLPMDNPLIKWIMLKKQPLIYEEIKRQAEESREDIYKKLEENMRLLTASVIIPSLLEKKPMGFIVLGDKMSGQVYTLDDLNVFQVLASQAALAIENAKFIEEAKEMQLQIAQAEKMATIGTMADGLSHQINNRFYALSLIAGDSIDTIKHADIANCTPEIKEMINQINHALERIQTNVGQGSEVVKGILKYTRKEETAFEIISLDQVIDGTLEMAQYKVKLSEIDIIRDYLKEIPKLKANLVQLEEVFFNFVDNAYDSIVERRNLLQEPGYRGKIMISAAAKDKVLEIIVQDNGLGVKEENIKKVFTPFFTTKVSSRKGTGLGLYVVNKIITDGHKGKINFASQYKVGTRFTLELPIAA